MIQTSVGVIKRRGSGGHELKTMVVVVIATGNLTALFCQSFFFFPKFLMDETFFVCVESAASSHAVVCCQ